MTERAAKEKCFSETGSGSLEPGETDQILKQVMLGQDSDKKLDKTEQNLQVRLEIKSLDEMYQILKQVRLGQVRLS